MTTPPSPVVGFAGMTHLGVVSSASVAAKGFRTICFDADASTIARLARGDMPVVEPDLDELVRANGARQEFTADLARLGACDVVYISTDVPTDDKGASDLTGIRDLLDRVGAVLKADAILVILFQAPPGFSRELKVVPHARLYYQVETLVFGRAVQRALHPERTIVGCADPAKPIAPAYLTLLEAFGCPILPMRYESAELAKIAINCCLVSSISVANTLSEICENIGADWSEIAPSLKLDARIGPHSYLAPGLGIAGGNLERDLATVVSLSERHDTDAGVVRAWIANSRHRRDWAAQTIRAALLDARPQAKIAVWGLAYKENTHSIKNSPSLATLAALPHAHFVVHDPVVAADAVAHAHVEGGVDPVGMLKDADALMILTPWPHYRAIAADAVAKALRGRVVVDPYAVLGQKAAAAAGLDYYCLGAPRTKESA
jgi:UDPglucose 6-dehydrogenase